MAFLDLFQIDESDWHYFFDSHLVFFRTLITCLHRRKLTVCRRISRSKQAEKQNSFWAKINSSSNSRKVKQYVFTRVIFVHHQHWLVFFDMAHYIYLFARNIPCSRIEPQHSISNLQRPSFLASALFLKNTVHTFSHSWKWFSLHFLYALGQNHSFSQVVVSALHLSSDTFLANCSSTLISFNTFIMHLQHRL